MSLKAYQSLSKLINQKERNLTAIKEAIQIAKKDLQQLKDERDQLSLQIHKFPIEQKRQQQMDLARRAEVKNRLLKLEQLISGRKEVFLHLKIKNAKARILRTQLKEQVKEQVEISDDLVLKIEKQVYEREQNRQVLYEQRKIYRQYSNESKRLKPIIHRRILKQRHARKLLASLSKKLQRLLSHEETMIQTLQTNKKEVSESVSTVGQKEKENQALQRVLFRIEKQLEQREQLVKVNELRYKEIQEGFDIREKELAKRERIINTKEYINKL